MSDKKISQLTSLAQGDIASTTDVLAIVDTSATETKKATPAAIVGAAAAAGLTNVDINSGAIDGTAIGANSASTGAFTTLSASSSVTLSGGTANGVLYLNGSKVATSGSALTFDGTDLLTLAASTPKIRVSDSGLANDFGLDFYFPSVASSYGQVTLNGSTGGMRFVAGKSGSSGYYQAFELNGSEQARLTSTGLGIGTSSPLSKLHLNDATGTAVNLIRMQTAWNSPSGNKSIVWADGTDVLGRISVSYEAPSATMTFGSLYNSGYQTSSLMTLTASGNLGLGVTPSAWGGNYKALQFPGGAIASYQSNTLDLYSNAYDSGAGAWKYVTSDSATRYAQSGGSHIWLTAASGTAGNAISFSQAMTLDASGNLLVGTTSSGWAASGRQTVEVNGSSSALVGLRIATALSGYMFHDGTDMGVANSQNGYLRFITNNTERARIDASGNLGVGTTSPANRLSVAGSTGTIATFTNGATADFSIICGSSITSLNAGGANILAFQTGGTERARITAGGKFLLNTTSTVVSGDEIFGAIGDNGIGVKCTGGSTFFAAGLWNNANSGDNLLVNFYTETGGTNRGSITYNRTAGLIAYNTTSDIRLKENIADAEEAGGKIDAMQVRQFDWKETGNHLDYGFVAQELHAVAPHAVSKPEDDDKMWSVDYSKLVPMLVKEIQSLRARVAQLESN